MQTHWQITHYMKFWTKVIFKIIVDIRCVSLLRCILLRVAQNLDLLCHKFDHFKECGTSYRPNRSKVFFTNRSLLIDQSFKNPLHSSQPETTADRMEMSRDVGSFSHRFKRGHENADHPAREDSCDRFQKSSIVINDSRHRNLLDYVFDQS